MRGRPIDAVALPVGIVTPESLNALSDICGFYPGQSRTGIRPETQVRLPKDRQCAPRSRIEARVRVKETDWEHLY